MLLLLVLLLRLTPPDMSHGHTQVTLSIKATPRLSSGGDSPKTDPNIDDDEVGQDAGHGTVTV